MHSTGFEPVTFQRKTDYESGAFNHSATNAFNLKHEGNRTLDIQNRNLMLYPLSYMLLIKSFNKIILILIKLITNIKIT